MTINRSLLFALLFSCIFFILGTLFGYAIAQNHHWFSDVFFSPMNIQTNKDIPKDLPLLKLSIPELQKESFGTTNISILGTGTPEAGYTRYTIQFTVLNKQMTGQLNVPDSIDTSHPPAVILMLRGYVPQEIYSPGMGTKNVAARLSQAGYITLAPDFFGYGDSDPEPDDPWQARFEKPVIVATILSALEESIPVSPQISVKPGRIGIWAHSNGGQIALTTLEVLRMSYPTTLWAPVTAPFPYSILYFGDEVEDEGKSQRAWISLFEKNYDAHDFSHTQFLKDLRGPLQFQQGTADDAVPYFWTEEFIAKLKKENEVRFKEASAPAKIEYLYHKYPGADHNLSGAWETAIERDLIFFAQHLNTEKN